jgi:hypothetical protein
VGRLSQHRSFQVQHSKSIDRRGRTDYVDGGAPVATFPLPATVDPEWPGLRWTPDGAGLTYVSTVQGVSNIWRQALSGGEAKPLTDFKENRIFFFDWSLNDRKLVLVRGNDTRDLIIVREFLNANNSAF